MTNYYMPDAMKLTAVFGAPTDIGNELRELESKRILLRLLQLLVMSVLRQIPINDVMKSMRLNRFYAVWSQCAVTNVRRNVNLDGGA